MMVGQSHDLVAMNRGECVRKDEQAPIRFACQSIEDTINVGRRIDACWDRLQAQKGGGFRDRALVAHPARMVWILQDRNARHGRSDFLEQRQPFAAHAIFIKIREPGYIGFRTSRVQHDGTLGSVQDLDKDDWYCVGLDSQCGQSGRSVDDDDVRCRARQLFCQRMRAVNVARSPVIVRPDVACFRPTQVLQRLAERRNARLCLRIALGKAHQHADPPHALALLRARRDRPCCRAAEQRDERAPLHSITSPARASRVGGISMPSMRAVWALMTSSNLADCSTGKSAGLAPLRMRPAYTPCCRYVSTILAP